VKSPWFRLAVGIGFSLLLLYLAFRNTTFKGVMAVIRQADLWWVALALFSVVATNLYKIFRWQVMIGAQGSVVKFRDLAMSNLSGQMLNTLLPVRVGDLSRAYVIGREGPGWPFVLGTIVLEKLFDLIWYVLLFLLLLILIPAPAWVNDSFFALILAAFAFTAITVLMATQRVWVTRLVEKFTSRWTGKWQQSILSWLQNGLDSLKVIQQRRDLVKIAFWTSLIWLQAVVTNYFVMLSLNIHLSLTASLLVLVALMAGISVATVPGRIGIFELICVLSLSVYGIGRTEALGYGLLLHAIVYIPTTLAGVICFFMLTNKNKTNLSAVEVDGVR
jgi:glycosyltransferase 2 family protein